MLLFLSPVIQGLRLTEPHGDKSETNECGRKIIFVGGHHHSGTSIMQHTIMFRYTNLTKRAPESWPVSRSVCAKEKAHHWQVYKHPTNNPEEVRRMLDLRKSIPNIRLVFMRRDIPNQIWSLMKRAKQTKSIQFARTQLQNLCAVNKAWGDVPHYEKDSTIELSDFTHRYKDIVDSFMKAPRFSLEGIPPDSENEKLREWQVFQPIWPYNATKYQQEAPADLVNVLSQMHC